MQAIVHHLKSRFQPEQIFMISALIVNAGNYLYNLLLGRILGPELFADAAILITLLLVLSFVAMTFQIVVTKFSIEFETNKKELFIRWAYKWAMWIGVLIGAFMVVFSEDLQLFFNTQSSFIFTLFGLAVPLYFVLSVKRGKMQGESSFINLSITYQLEMFARLLVTFALVLLIASQPIIGVSIGVVVSFLAGIFPVKFKRAKTQFAITSNLSSKEKKQVLHFFLLTALYECVQIVCNNSDILLVKHYFPSYESGLYASLALIGRVVYFVTWMFIMLLLPKVIEANKQSKNSKGILLKYLGYITGLSLSIVCFLFLFPELSVQLLFGEQFLAVANLLGWYAIATSLFAISNLFTYYYLSLNKYVPLVFALVMSVVQVLLIVNFHESLWQVVLSQIAAMGILFVLQLIFFIVKENSLKSINR